MSIRLVQNTHAGSAKMRINSIVGETPLLLPPNPQQLYTLRSQRLAELKAGNPLSEYLDLCHKISQIQAALIDERPITHAPATFGQIYYTPLALAHSPLTLEWQDYLTAMLHRLTDINPAIDLAIVQLTEYTADEKQLLAHALLQGKFTEVNTVQSLLIWSALSCYYSQRAAQLTLTAHAEGLSQSQFCPVCDSYPTASMVMSDKQQGARYLHCSLCETQWYLPRVKCTNCESLDSLDYYSFDEALAATKTECCTQCKSYLKIFYQERDPHIEVVADDLASLHLDEAMEQEGYAKTGLNPLLFPAAE